MTTEALRSSRRVGSVAPDWLAATIIGVLAGALSFWGSWSISLWTDEAATISAIRRTPQQLVELLGHIDAVHGAYYLFLQQWADVFGYSSASLRLPSAFAVAVAAAGVYVLTRMFADQRVALVAAGIFAVLPRTTWMGTEARSFAFTAALAVWLTIVLVAVLRRRRWWLWVVYALLAALSIAINIFVALLLAAHLVTVLATRRIGWGTRVAWAGASVVGVLLASPVVLVATRQKGQLGDIEFGVVAWLRGFVVNQWFLGSTPTPVYATTSGPSVWSVAAVLLAVVCWALAVWAVAAGTRAALRRRQDGEAALAGDDPDILSVVLPWIVIPPVLAGLYSALVSPLYNPRYFTFATPAIAILVGLGLCALPRLWLRVTAAVAILVLAAPVYVSQRQPDAKSGTDWNAASAYIAGHAHVGDGVYFSPLHEPTGRIVGPTTRTMAIAYPSAFTGLVDATAERSPAQDASLTGTSALLSDSGERLASVDRLWVVRRDDYPAELARADAAFLQREGFVRETTWHGTIDTVEEYVRR
ncbi:glycosyltransferase family 39 protein [Leifsonia sp. LS-T14]|uniref:glycosyltransferase family 39 protein n=1 Tax=unclassified Leifsonia TaxID=2663824 RepID=UPI0035A63E6C